MGHPVGYPCDVQLAVHLLPSFRDLLALLVLMATLESLLCKEILEKSALRVPKDFLVNQEQLVQPD